jgi:propanol-preferring alcohol dehydrogenase
MMPKHRSNELRSLKSPVQVSVRVFPHGHCDSNDPGQILVKINWTGLCASDKSLLHDEWAAFGATMADSACGIAGHEGAGEVVLAHPDVQDLWQPGDRAGVKWVVSTCKRCEFCTNGTDELHCPKQLNSGLTAPGTFQEYVLTDGRYATR